MSISIERKVQPQRAPGTASARGDRVRLGVIAVAAAVVAALAVWVVVEIVFGLDLRQPAASVDETPADISAAHVALAATVGSVAGWALLAGLERVTSRARGVWTAIAALALLASLGGPLSGTGISDTNRLVLALMHVVVAAVVVAAVYRTPRAPRTVSRTSR